MLLYLFLQDISTARLCGNIFLTCLPFACEHQQTVYCKSFFSLHTLILILQKQIPLLEGDSESVEERK